MRPMENWRVSIYMNHVLVDEKVFQSEAPPDADIIRAMEALHTETGTYIITAYAVYSLGVIRYDIKSAIEKKYLE